MQFSKKISGKNVLYLYSVLNSPHHFRMDLPKFAPRREIDLYVYQKNEINRTLEQFSKRLHSKPSNTVKSPDKKSQDIFSVVHAEVLDKFFQDMSS